MNCAYGKDIYKQENKEYFMKLKKQFVFLFTILVVSGFLFGNVFAENTALTAAGARTVSAPSDATTANAAVNDATGTIKSYASGAVTRNVLKAKLEEKYAAGTLTRQDLKNALTIAYRYNVLKREDLRYIITNMYKENTLTRDDLKWILNQAYAHKELTRDDLRYIITVAYKNGELTREDIKFLVIEAYKAGELKRDDVMWLIVRAYKNGELTKEDLKWLVVNSYKEGKLTRDDLRALITAAYSQGELTKTDVRWLLVNSYKEGVLTRDDLRTVIAAAYNHGELTRADIKWLFINSYKEGILTKEDVKELLRAAYKKGELRKSDVEWILNEGYKTGEITQSEISIAETTGETVAVEAQPASVASMPEVTTTTVATAAESSDTTTSGTSATTAVRDELKTTQAWMLYKYALVPMERHRIGMEALIGYVEGINGSTAKLVELKNQFVAQQDSLKAAAEKSDYTGGRAIVEQMKKTVADFRTNVRAQIGTNTEAAKAALNNALEANEEYLDSLVTEAREAKKNRNLEAFDFTNAKIQARLDKEKSNGADVSALQAKLDEIKDTRSALIDAMNTGIESCKGEGIGKCTKTEAQNHIKLRAELETDYMQLRELAKQIGQSQKIGNAITQAYNIIANAEKTIAAAERNGLDVSVQKARLAEIKGIVNGANAKYLAREYTGAANDLKSAQSAFETLKKNTVTTAAPTGARPATATNPAGTRPIAATNR
ncbi:hypothetical protein L6303_07030 [archaeon]|nr:hypothetical protein [Nanoarchaeota archaeon]MBU4452016.1 hypothetical protein [Nanoarchaeota archaeon]MCG2724471.1 hypothetical protein [archaeon]